ncbi:nitrogen fixation protein NifQ [Burkholderia sp. SIMBA_062]|uniref:nitrogen fixation protein NifQ n=1 Tax=Burkholderia sp. SIMBA_062 TaxID=3085803 RepID=UPI00397E3265
MTSALGHAHRRVLQSLLSAAADAASPDARLFGALVAARACRNELALLDFPALAARNIAQQRWKKFLALEMAASLGLTRGPTPGCPRYEDFGSCCPLQR